VPVVAENIISIDSAAHLKISGFYSSGVSGTSLSVRDLLAGKSLK
jgi:hypothetical protein